MISVCHMCKKQCFETDKYYCNLTALKQKYIDLEKKYNLMKEALDYVMNQSNEALTLKPQQIVTIRSRFDRINHPLNVEYKETLPYWRFITLTFDPNKFGLNNDAADEKNYILYSLLEISNYVDHIYGCFEYQKNGAVHSHVLVRLNENGPIEKILKKQFTDNPRNRNAVQVDKAKYPNALNYINKVGIKEADRGDEWFYLKTLGTDGLDDGIDLSTTV